MDFSAASLLIKILGEDKVIAGLDRIDKKAQATAQKATEGMREWSRVTEKEITDRAAQFDQIYGKKVKDVVDEVANKVDAAMQRSARGTLAVSRGLEVMARTGKESGRALDSIFEWNLRIDEAPQAVEQEERKGHGEERADRRAG